MFSTLLPTMTAFGQKKTAAKVSATKPGAAKQQYCQGGWTGSITYTKTLNDSLESDEPGIRKNIDRIKHKNSRSYNYTVRTIVDGSNPQNPSVKSRVSFNDKDLKWGEERVFDTCNSRENGHWFIIEGTDNALTTAEMTGPARSFNLNVDELNGTYSFNLQMPHAQGKYNREETMRRSGHCQPKNNLPWDRSTNNPVKIDGESFSIYGEKFDRDKPDEISGSKAWADGTERVKGFHYSVSWRFTRCPKKLLITDLRFEHMKFPTWDAWEEVDEHAGTVDGNLVKIKARVANMSSEAAFAEVMFKETYRDDKYEYMRDDYPLKDNSVSIRLDAGEEREVEVLWDTTGYAWYDDGRPRPVQRVKVEAWEEYKLKDSVIENIEVHPKPLILVHGIYSSPKSFELYSNQMIAHGYSLRPYIFGEKPEFGAMKKDGVIQSVFDNADELARYVRHVQEQTNAWHVDMAAHSTGGLVARLFIHKHAQILPDGNAHVRHLMMLGTPNNGVPCANSIANYPEVNKDKLKSAEELMPDAMARFNQHVRDRKGTKFSALAGNAAKIHCSGMESNDDFVSVASVTSGVSDFALTSLRHPELVDTSVFHDFIRPHIITGPRGTYPIPVVSLPGGRDGRIAAP